jgi:hypothetical protein
MQRERERDGVQSVLNGSTEKGSSVRLLYFLERRAHIFKQAKLNHFISQMFSSFKFVQ